jgi:hypothetical protein
MKYKDFLERKSKYGDEIDLIDIYNELGGEKEEKWIQDFLTEILSGQTVRAVILKPNSTDYILRNITLVENWDCVILLDGINNEPFKLKLHTKYNHYIVNIHHPIQIWGTKINLKEKIEEYKIKIDEFNRKEDSEKFGL